MEQAGARHNGFTFFGYPRYNPTNGSRSRGNIERCGPGQIPQDKYRYFWD